MLVLVTQKIVEPTCPGTGVLRTSPCQCEDEVICNVMYTINNAAQCKCIKTPVCVLPLKLKLTSCICQEPGITILNGTNATLGL
jgi:hypothetical protein